MNSTADKKSSKTALWVGLGLTALGIGYWLYTQVGFLMKYCYKIKYVSYSNLSYSNVDVAFTLAFRNFSMIKSEIQEVDVDLSVNDIFLCKVYSKKEQTLTRNGVSDLSFNVKVSPKTLLSHDLPNIIKLTGVLMEKNSDKVLIKTKGTVSVKVFCVDIKKVKLDITMTIKDIMADDPNAFICYIS